VRKANTLLANVKRGRERESYIINLISNARDPLDKCEIEMQVMLTIRKCFRSFKISLVDVQENRR